MKNVMYVEDQQLANAKSATGFFVKGMVQMVSVMKTSLEVECLNTELKN